MLPHGGGRPNPQHPDYNADTSASLVDADEIGFWENVSLAWKKINYLNLKATLKAYFDTIYAVGPLSGSLDPLLYGPGADGVIDFDGIATFAFATLAGSTYTLNRTIYGTIVTVESGVTIVLDGSGLFANVSITLNGTAVIKADGNSGSGITAGATLGGLSDA